MKDYRCTDAGLLGFGAVQYFGCMLTCRWNLTASIFSVEDVLVCHLD
jgi:hypothetical protein